MEVRRRSASTTTTVSAPVNVGTPPRSPKEAAASVAALCYGFPKDLKDSLNALQADRAVLAAQPPSSRPLTPDNRLLNKEELSFGGLSWTSAGSMNCLQLSNSILQMTTSSCNKTAEEASSVRQLLLGAGTPSSASCASSPGSTSSADRGYGLPFCMDDDQLTDTCDTSLPELV